MRSEQARLEDVRENILLAEMFLGDSTVDQFEADIAKLYAVTRCLEIISEASRQLSPELKGRYPTLRWPEIAGAGNVYRHDYERISPAVIWGTVRNALPPLLAAVEAELASTR
jgi:uncharacterized protein with HEPN domain